ncbi:pyridoxamine 5'-phosphate oxidase family protein [Ruegeria pomeroyi]|uniref:Pyridoxamine 5'-phosphate oxidase family protein n=1 Tax=Ruegeria pomeroyi TaxID=89184 RepID=A0A9Q3WL01_9RHOB|nr:pyridoxamine 5'-phosphate oxidase family protein [Ruegeria pomeroyi]MCE8537694.1 pyridoxamine 5'-phosphate oxidase family protein [Ruegeria pomeroyi]
MTDPYLHADAEARAQARGLIDTARYGALAVLQPGGLTPSVSRIALATDAQGMPVSLISSLSAHTAALETTPACALLIGEPGGKGDPLTHPRLTLHCIAQLITRGTSEHDTLRARYLALRPKAGLYADFGDFRFVRFIVTDGLLNAGFGRAVRLSAKDLAA